MSENKKELRRRMLAQRAAQSAQEKAEIDRRITEQVLAGDAYRAARCLFCYVSTPEEIDTHAILRRALADGKTVCVPRCGAQGAMSARRIRTLDELRPGAYGILEPGEEAAEVAPAEIDLVLAPALACDHTGYRLGYGGGYYDRFLCRTKAVCMALCAEARLVQSLPREAFDVRCHTIVTERRVLRADEE